MNRLILALMALLAGFSAQVAPASERVSEGTEIGAAVNAKLFERQAAVFAAATDGHIAPIQELSENRDFEALAPQVAEMVGVRIGIDRARE